MAAPCASGRGLAAAPWCWCGCRLKRPPPSRLSASKPRLELNPPFARGETSGWAQNPDEGRAYRALGVHEMGRKRRKIRQVGGARQQRQYARTCGLRLEARRQAEPE